MQHAESGLQLAESALQMRWTTSPASSYAPAMTKADDRSQASYPVIARSAFRLLACLLMLTLGGSLRAQAPATATSNDEAKGGFALRILDPRGDAASTTREVVHVLGRTSPDAKVTVAGEAARVFGTGMFVRDNVPLQMGENRITVVATAPNGQKLERIVTLNREAETPPSPEPKERRLEIDETSIEPAQNVILFAAGHPRIEFSRHAGPAGGLLAIRGRLATDG